MPLAADVSNWTGELTPAMINEMKGLGVKKVIVQVVEPAWPYPPAVWQQQMTAALNAGMALDYYVYLWNGTSFADQMSAAAAKVSAFIHPDNIGVVWADIEDPNDTAWDRDTIGREITEMLRQHPGAGVYTGKWWADAYTNGGYKLPVGTPLWAAQYDDKPSLDVFQLFWGISRPDMKQYEGDRILKAAERPQYRTKDGQYGYPYGGQIDLNWYEDPAPIAASAALQPVSLSKYRRTQLIGQVYANDLFGAYGGTTEVKWTESPRGAGWVRMLADLQV